MRRSILLALAAATLAGGAYAYAAHARQVKAA